MSIMQEIFLGIRHYGTALKLISKHRMWPLLVGSFFIFLLILLVCGSAIYGGIDSLVDWIMHLSWVERWNNLFDESSWIVTTFKIGIYLASIFLFISLGKFVFLALGSPLYAYISEKGAEKYKGVEYPFSTKQFLKDIVRGVRLAIRNFFKQMFLTLLLFIFSFIPVVGLIFSFLIIVLDSYYYGFSMLDYNCEREKMSVRDSLKFVKSHRGLALGNGLIFYAVMIFIPFIGIIFIAPISAIAAMISYFHVTENA